MIGNFINIYQKEGKTGLWKGISLTAQRAATVGFVVWMVMVWTKKGREGRSFWGQVMLWVLLLVVVTNHHLGEVYNLTKKHLIPLGLMGDTVYTHFLSSFTCGLAGVLASNPVNVVRTCTMNQRVLCDDKHPGYKDTLDCLLQTWKNEGFFALYKGFWLT